MIAEPSREHLTAPEGKAALGQLLSTLIKLALAPGSEHEAKWRAEAVEAQRGAAGVAGGIDGARIDALWNVSVKAAERDAVVRRDETVNPTLPTVSPLTLQRLAADPFDLDAAVQTIRESASSG